MRCNSRVYGDPSASKAYFVASAKHLMGTLKFRQNQVAPTIFTLNRPLLWFIENCKDHEVKAMFQTRLDKAIMEYGKAAAEAETALDIEQEKNGWPSRSIIEALRCDVTVIEHVDDYGIAAEAAGQKWFAVRMAERFKVGKFGRMETFLGMTIIVNVEAATIRVAQPAIIAATYHKYGKLCEERGLIGCRLPAKANMDLAGKPDPKEAAEYAGLPMANIGGALSYIAQWTRPEIINPTRQISRHFFNFGQEEFEAALRILAYLFATKDQGIAFSGRNATFGTAQIWSNADASFGLKCYTGVAVFLQGGPIAVEYGKINSAQTSSGTAEIAAQSQSVRMCLGVKNILSDPAMHERWGKGGTPITIGDNQACIKACTTLGALSALTRHMERQLMFVREIVCRALVVMIWWPTEDMCSDMITKCLAEPNFMRHCMEITGHGCALWSEEKLHKLISYNEHRQSCGQS